MIEIEGGVKRSSKRDLELIARCQAGELDSYGQLVADYKDWVFGLIFQWIGQKEIAEEMTQEVFVKAFSELKNFRKESKFSTWLYQITLNRCRDFWKSQEGRQGKNLDLETIKSKSTQSTAIEEGIINKERIQNMRRLLETLPSHYREALSLKYLSEMDYASIAKCLGSQESAVRMRVFRGLKLLRKKLGKETEEVKRK